MLNSNFFTDGLTSIKFILENFNVVYSYLDNYIILGFDIVIVGIIILFSGKAKKLLEIGSQIATIIGTGIAAKAYSDSKKNDSNSSSNSDSNTNTNSNTNSDSNSKKNYLIPFLTINKKKLFNLFKDKDKNLKLLPILGVISPENATDITQFGYFVLGLSIIILWTLINVLGYLSAVHILSISNFESKYPKLLIFFKYFKYSSITFVVIQGIICIISVLTLIYISYLFINL